MVAAHRPRSAFSQLITALRWYRRWVAALLAAVTVFVGLRVVAPPPAATVEVVVAEHDLPGGRTLARDDLTTVRLPAEVAPSEVVADPASLVGSVIVAPLSRGTPLTRAALLDAERRPRQGLVIAPVRVPDTVVARLVAVGDRVNLVGSDADGREPRVLAGSARVVTVLWEQGSEGAFSIDAAPDAPIILVEVSAESALKLATAGANDGVSIVFA